MYNFISMIKNSNNLQPKSSLKIQNLNNSKLRKNDLKIRENALNLTVLYK